MAKPKKADNKTIGTTFIIAGAGMIVSLGLTVGWVFAPAGLSLAIVGLVYLGMDKDDGE